MAGSKPGHKSHKPDERSRKQVEECAAMGLSEVQTGRLIGVSHTTLRKYYRAELDAGFAKANLAVARSLYRLATDGKNVAAAIWWEKTRSGRSDKQAVEVSGAGGGPVQHVWAYERPDPKLIEEKCG